MNRMLACPWQKVIQTEKRVGDFNTIDNNKSRLTTQIITTVNFGTCTGSCPFYDGISGCRRINKHD